MYKYCRGKHTSVSFATDRNTDLISLPDLIRFKFWGSTSGSHFSISSIQENFTEDGTTINSGQVSL